MEELLATIIKNQEVMIQNQETMVSTINLVAGVISGILLGLIFWNVIKEVD